MFLYYNYTSLRLLRLHSLTQSQSAIASFIFSKQQQQTLERRWQDEGSRTIVGVLAEAIRTILPIDIQLQHKITESKLEKARFMWIQTKPACHSSPTLGLAVGGSAYQADIQEAMGLLTHQNQTLDLQLIHLNMLDQAEAFLVGGSWNMCTMRDQLSQI